MIEWSDRKTEYYPCSNPQKVEIFWNWMKVIVSGIVGFVIYLIWKKR